jgi:DNA-binding HxlR family transcriptional regulator
MAPHTRHIGHATLDLLIEPHIVPILRALMDGPRSPSELEQRLPDLPHSSVMRRLGELRSRGLARHERHNGLPPTAKYDLTAPGRMILGVTAAAERWERNWTTENSDGLEALRTIADERTREILLALAEGPRSAMDLLPEVGLTRSPLRQRLSDLVASGILNVETGTAHATYALSACARELMLVSVAAARWSWEHAPPAHAPAASNVARALLMFAPHAQLPADLHGTCRLQVGHGVDGRVVHLAAAGRCVEALDKPPTDEPEATCRAAAGAWCDGLLLLRWDGVSSAGNRALMAAMLASVSAALIT